MTLRVVARSCLTKTPRVSCCPLRRSCAVTYLCSAYIRSPTDVLKNWKTKKKTQLITRRGFANGEPCGAIHTDITDASVMRLYMIPQKFCSHWGQCTVFRGLTPDKTILANVFCACVCVFVCDFSRLIFFRRCQPKLVSLFLCVYGRRAEDFTHIPPWILYTA